ncbi:MAG: Rieske (2Fe-2S) protein [Gemmatimonadaceae bacterium]|nr:Rieske (2Fe-2S) protein [Gemmatimonadaceae bacterium]
MRLGEAALFDIGVPFKRDFTETISDAWVESRSLKSVWLYTEDGESYTAYNGRCTHLGCGYSFDKEEGVFHCPCHHGLFDLKTGAVVGGPPPRPLDRLEVKVEDGNVLVLYKDYRIGVAEKVEA